jgi:membrane protease YdiL (CAAX protease family)
MPAACISAALFGAVHVYSLAGLLEVAWTGFILAVAYERCRSLWPCILAHAFNNLFYFAGMLLLFR